MTAVQDLPQGFMDHLKSFRGSSSTCSEEFFKLEKKVNKGVGNDGVYIYSLVSNPEFKFVEKVVNRKADFDFSKLLESTQDTDLKKIFPSVYLCRETQSEMQVFMEYLPDTGRKRKSLDFVQALSSRVAELNRVGEKESISGFFIKKCSFSSRPTKKTRVRLINDASALSLKINPKVDELRSYLADNLDPVLSHGDLFYPNIASSSFKGGCSVKLIDFGLVKYLLPGADFHHFARSWILGKDDFFLTLLDCYSEMTRNDRSILKMAALIYALDKQILRTFKNCKKGSSGSRVEEGIYLINSLQEAIIKDSVFFVNKKSYRSRILSALNKFNCTRQR